ncbi:peroxiredoxin-like family protein [Rubinisphaera brasiliensis]|uniref:thioredoxin-dependent peroxiredoxin n=1 Tax=Rubinisphaera brasiliensis (strain ATCC 49424 / DSM 5305 / JCM 21570 / IAM 15109 / NBRC 103401 / IFAM 1448) TaxID=756272 RepID=F0SMZ9_RUBBR|nr:peroxiredoxin-like family protein [Rubinisphaera brasiliensis]ADY60003.1 alkyl hydroperoxide reductase/ Thiol specific antioxidant/ Mal allergen [Rubinisphaera brasiliensis DSM 5305]
MKLFRSTLLLTAALLTPAVFSPGVSVADSKQSGIASSADKTKPLQAGEALPDVALKNLKGETVSLDSFHKNCPLVVVFYRGSWCPMCTKHFQQLIQAYPAIQQQGANLVAIGADSVQNSAANAKKLNIPFPMLSDSELKAAREFGLAFKVDELTLSKYRGKGYDLKQASGADHESLPVPAVYIVDQSGKILFAHSNPNYLERLDPNRIVEELKQQN